MSDEKTGNMFSNAKLSTIFLVVLGLHVLVIVLIGGYHLLRGESSADIAGGVVEPAVQQGYESIFSGENRDLSPRVETTYKTAPATSGGFDPMQVPMSMPAADDPVWTGQEPILANGHPNTGNEYPRPVTTYDNSTSIVSEVPVVEPQWRPAPVVATRTTPAPGTAPARIEQRVVNGNNQVQVYEVRPGDTLSRIAQRNGTTVAAIQKTNGINDTLIRVGQKIKLPAGRNATASTVPVPRAAAPSVGQASPRPVQAAPRAQVASTQSYQVNKGDTLWAIARRFDTKPDVIMRMNQLTDPSRLRVGDKLIVPSATSSASSTTLKTDMAMAPGQ